MEWIKQHIRKILFAIFGISVALAAPLNTRQTQQVILYQNDFVRVTATTPIKSEGTDDFGDPYWRINNLQVESFGRSDKYEVKVYDETTGRSTLVDRPLTADSENLSFDVDLTTNQIGFSLAKIR